MQSTEEILNRRVIRDITVGDLLLIGSLIKGSGVMLDIKDKMFGKVVNLAVSQVTNAERDQMYEEGGAILYHLLPNMFDNQEQAAMAHLNNQMTLHQMEGDTRDRS